MVAGGLMCLTGCAPKGKVLGKAPEARPGTVLAIHSGDAPATLTLEGQMVEKCPQAGCWFRLDDGTGLIKVDTKNAKFVVTKVPLQTKVKVEGKIVYDGSEPQLQASGLIY